MKSRMPEIVEPKQLIQSRVLVKRARLTVKRGAARPNGKSKPPQSPLRRAVRYRIRGAARHSTQDYQRGGRGRGTKNEGSASRPSKGGRIVKEGGESTHMRPNLPPRVFTGEFWHAHFNYAALRTDPALAAIGSMDGLAGSQWGSAPSNTGSSTYRSIARGL